MMGDQGAYDFSEVFFLLGVRSFARFYDLTIEEVDQLLNAPNEVFFEMVGEMEQFLSRYENFMAKVRRCPDKKEGLSRLEILDL